MNIDKLEKSMIGLAGEMRACAELLKKGYHASITFGNAKATDILVTGDRNQFLRIEVKTSANGRNFVTGYYPKYTEQRPIQPNIWIFYLPDKERSSHGDRFFIATHEQVAEIQLKVNKGNKTLKGKGCDNIPVKFLEEANIENKWDTISEMIHSK